MTFEYDTDQTTSMISVISQNTQSAKETKSASHYGEKEFCIITSNPLALTSTHDVPVQYSDIRPALDIKVILISIIMYKLVVVIMMLSRKKPTKTKMMEL